MGAAIRAHVAVGDVAGVVHGDAAESGRVQPSGTAWRVQVLHQLLRLVHVNHLDLRLEKLPRLAGHVQREAALERNRVVGSVQDVGRGQRARFKAGREAVTSAAERRVRAKRLAGLAVNGVGPVVRRDRVRELGGIAERHVLLGFTIARTKKH